MKKYTPSPRCLSAFFLCLGLVCASLARAQYVVSGNENVPAGSYTGLRIQDNGDVGNIVNDITLSGSIMIGQSGTNPGETVTYLQNGGNVEFTSHTDVVMMPRSSGGTGNFTVQSGTFNRGPDYYRINFRAPDGNRGAGGDIMNLNFMGGSALFDVLMLNADNGPNDASEATSPVVNLNLSGGVLEYRGINSAYNPNFGPNNAVNITVSGGELLNSSLTRASVLGESTTLHIEGSGATNIEILTLTSSPTTRFQFTVDAGGVTPLNIGGGGNDSLFGIIDMGFSVMPSPGEIFTLIDSTGGADYSNLSLDPADAATWSLITGGEDLQVSYVPEPSTFTLILIAMMGAVFVYRRRK